MSAAKDDGRSEGLSIELTREFAAPRELVFRNWTDAGKMQGWFAPDGHTVTEAEADARPGGHWRIAFASAAGELHVESGEFLEIEAPHRLVLTLTQSDAAGREGQKTRITVTLTEAEGRTRMHFVQTGYTSAAARDGNREGWSECFAKLERQLAGT
jgi:uncharacterized protein YndB with AHSA1/START domain